MGGIEAYGAMNLGQPGPGGVRAMECGPASEQQNMAENSYGDGWFAGSMDNLDPGVWDNTMDWGPVNLF